MSGICFVGYMDHAYRGGLVLAPVGGAVLIGLTFLFKGNVHLKSLCNDFSREHTIMFAFSIISQYSDEEGHCNPLLWKTRT